MFRQLNIVIQRNFNRIIHLLFFLRLPKFLKIRMRKSLVDSNPLIRIKVEHFPEKVLATLRKGSIGLAERFNFISFNSAEQLHSLPISVHGFNILIFWSSKKFDNKSNLMNSTLSRKDGSPCYHLSKNTSNTPNVYSLGILF